MRALKLNVTETGSKEAMRQLLGLGSTVRHARPAFLRVAVALLRLNRAIFEAQGGGEYGQAKWPALKDRTRERKSRDRLDADPGRATGALYDALTTVGAKGQTRTITDTELRLGVELLNDRKFPYPFAFNKRRPLLARDEEVAAVTRRELQRYFAGSTWRATRG